MYIKTGVSNGNYIEVTEGLSDGDEVYVEVEVETSSGVASLLSGLFGRQQFNMPSGGSGMRGGSSSMPGGSNFDFSNMPSFGGGERSGSGSGSGWGGGNR